MTHILSSVIDSIDFFKDAGGVSYVRLIGDHTGKHVGYGFVDFSSVNDANKARA